MVDNLFGETPKYNRVRIDLEGNTISYSSNGELITLTVVDSQMALRLISLCLLVLLLSSCAMHLSNFDDTYQQRYEENRAL